MSTNSNNQIPTTPEARPDHLVVATERATFGGIPIIINRDAADQLRAGRFGDISVTETNLPRGRRAFHTS